MKMKIIFALIMCLMVNNQFTLFAQNRVNGEKKKRPTPEQLMERQTNQMVRKLMLDDATTAKFVPVYQDYLKELRECKSRKYSVKQESKKTGIKPDRKPILTDAEVEGMIVERFAQSRKLLDVREKYYNEFKEILSPKQIVKIYRMEQYNISKNKKKGFDHRKEKTVAQKRHKSATSPIRQS